MTGEGLWRPALADFQGSWRERRLFDRHALPVYCIALASVAVIAAAVAFGGFAFDPGLAASLVATGGPVLLLAYAARWVGFPTIAAPVEQLMLLSLVGLLLMLCSLVHASANAPMADGLLAALDTAMGFDRAAVLPPLVRSPVLKTVWIHAYNSLQYTPAIVIVAAAVTGRLGTAWRLVTAMTGSAFASIAFVAILPAYGTPPFPYEFEAVLDGARDGSLRTFRLSAACGIITFPSMHAAYAVIIGHAFTRLGRWAAPLVALNGVMFLSALVVGGHYLVDLIAGGAIGMAAILLAARCHDRIAASGVRTVPA